MWLRALFFHICAADCSLILESSTSSTVSQHPSLKSCCTSFPMTNDNLIVMAAGETLIMDTGVIITDLTMTQLNLWLETKNMDLKMFEALVSWDISIFLMTWRYHNRWMEYCPPRKPRCPPVPMRRLGLHFWVKWKRSLVMRESCRPSSQWSSLVRVVAPLHHLHHLETLQSPPPGPPAVITPPPPSRPHTAPVPNTDWPIQQYTIFIAWPSALSLIFI